MLSGSDPFYLSKKLRRRRYGEVSAQTSQKSQNRALEKKKLRTVRLRRKHVPHHVDHQQNIFKIGNPSGEPEQIIKKKKKDIVLRGIHNFNLFPSLWYPHFICFF